MKALTYVEIDIDYCSLTYGVPPCSAVLEDDLVENETYTYQFQDSNEGFGTTQANLTVGPDASIFAPSSSDPQLRSPSGLAIDGSVERIIRLDIERVTARTGGATLQNDIFYSTGGHGESGSFTKDFSTEDLAVGERRIIDIDMSSLTVGGTDWISNTITQFRVDLDNGSGAGTFKIYGIYVGHLASALEATGTKKCFNTIATCQARADFTNVPVTLRFAMPTDYLPKEIECIPSLKSVSITPSVISLGENLGQRASLTIEFGDHRWSDTGPGFDKYVTERSYNPFTQGTFWGKFRARQPYLRGRPIRIIRGIVGQDLADMETRHYVIDSFDGPDSDGSYRLVAKDILKLADGDRAQAPTLSNGFLVSGIDTDDIELVLSPEGIGEEEYPSSGYVAIGGKEIVAFERSTIGIDANTLLMLHFNGVDTATTYTDDSASARTATSVGNAQLDTAQKKFGTASLRLDGTGDYITFPDSADWTFSGDFTIDGWFWPEATSGTDTLWSHSTDANNQYLLTVDATGVLTFSVISAGVTIVTMSSAAGALVDGSFQHVAVVRSGTVYKIYVDGVQVATTTDADAIPNFTSTFRIGVGGGALNAFDGWVDEFRVSNVARWTAAFTPPSAPYDETGDTLQITRAQLGTIAAEHDSQDRVQLVLRYVGMDPSDIIADLFETYAGIDPSYIPITSWLTETETFLRRLYTGTIAEPTGVNELVSELIEQAGLVVWWSDTLQEIRLQVLRAISTTADEFTPENYIEGSFQSEEQPDKRLSQVWTYFGQRDPLKRQDDPDNYRSAAATVDLEAQTDYGAPAIKKIFSRWIPAFGRPVALRLNDILIGRFRTPPRRFNFSIFRQYGDSTIEEVALGGGYRLDAWTLQDDTGAAVDAPIQVVRLKPHAEKFDVEAEEMLFVELDETDLSDKVIIIDSNSLDLNIRDIYDTLYPEPVDGDEVSVIVEAGVIVGASLVTIPAMDIGDWPSGVIITLTIHGRIQGRGGRGATGTHISNRTGLDGGDALYTRYPIIVDNTDGEIFGGGGGGTLGVQGSTFTFLGGGGGSGYLPGSGGTTTGSSSWTDAENGTTEVGGAGAFISASFYGGAGGGPGLDGELASPAYSGSDVPGSPGDSINGDSYVTFTTGGEGDIRGPQTN